MENDRCLGGRKSESIHEPVVKLVLFRLDAAFQVVFANNRCGDRSDLHQRKLLAHTRVSAYHVSIMSV